MKLPNFIVAGCAKSGSTALYTYLLQHPDVFMSTPKEPRYFFHPEKRPDFSGPMDEERYNQDTVFRWEDYCQLFLDSDSYEAVGEASPVYMMSTRVPSEIRKKLPEVKIIILLRNPIDIACSAYNHQVREGIETLSFREALLNEAERASHNWAWHWRYTGIGMVVPEVLVGYRKLFGEDKIKLIFYDDFENDNEAVVRDVFEWLGIDATVPIMANRVNVSGVYRYPTLRKMLEFMEPHITQGIKALLPHGLRKRVSGVMNAREYYYKLSRDDRVFLRDMFRDNINRLANITGRNLDHWLHVGEKSGRV